VCFGGQVGSLQKSQRAGFNTALSIETWRVIFGKILRFFVRMCAVSCSELQHAVCVAEPIQFESLRPEPNRLAAGGGPHALGITRNGSIYSWGENKKGALGHGDQLLRVVPTVVGGELSSRIVVQVSTSHHSACVTNDGMIFTWGSNDEGQLGTGDMHNRLSPTPVRGELSSKTAVQVSAGGAYTACVSAGGSVFSWGWNSVCRLGVGDPEAGRYNNNILVPTLVKGQLVGKVTLGYRTCPTS